MRIVIVFVLACLPAVGQIAERMQAFVDAHTVAGAVTLVSHGNATVDFHAFGMADIEGGRPMQKDTIFQIMSMTKPITAIGIMMLAEEGKLTLRDPVEQYLPEFRNQRVTANAGWDSARISRPDHPFTIRELLTHTAGVSDSPPAAIHDYTSSMSVPLDEVVRQVARQPLLFQPGTAWSYSSAGIEVLGRLIEVCSGQKYEDFIASRILRPLGMKDTFFFPPKEKENRIAMVYVSKDGKLVRTTNALGGDPAKYRRGAVFSAPGWGLYSTAEDLLHVYRMMLNGGVYENRRYLSPFSVHLMTEPQTAGIPRPVGWMGGADYGLAWEVVTDAYGELDGHMKGSYGHGGAFGTQGWIDPTNGLISILLIQRADGGADTLRRAFQNMAESGVAK